MASRNLCSGSADLSLRSDRYRPRWSLVGVAVGAAGYVASLTPTLLPRTDITQGIASSVVAVVGYGIGVIGESCARALADRVRSGRGSLPAPRRFKWRVAITVGIVAAAAAFTPLGVAWQQQQRVVVEVPGAAPTTPIVVVLTIGFVLVFRYFGLGLRALTRKISRILGRRGCISGGSGALANGGAILIIGAGFAVIAVLGYGASLIVFNRMNNQQPVAQIQPVSPLRSGGPGSGISWQSLGVQGRWFVSEGPTPAQISVVTGRSAVEPIRTYAGIETNADAQARARQAVADLVRAGGLERANIVVYTPSTNGYVDSTAAAAAEFVTDGDIASVSMQYTILPSSLSMVLDQAKALDAGIYLLRAAREAIAALPPDRQPRLYVYGESLGAYGSMAPFDGVGIAGFGELVAGAVWAGPPASSAYWRQLNSQATGGPGWQPIVADGSVVRYAADAAGLAQPAAPWSRTRGVFLQNSTDPVVWWSPDLIWNRPAWLDQPRGPGVPAEMTWLPLITFWQVFVDMPAAGGMPPGVGHNYQPDIGPTWVAVMQPKDWGLSQDAKLQLALKALPTH